MKTYRVIIADDHLMFRQALAKILEEDDDITVVAHVSDGEEALKNALRLKPDIVVLDSSMPKMDGIEAAERIKENLPDTAIIILSDHASESYVITALKIGVEGFLSKEADISELSAAIKSICNGKSAIDQMTAYKIISRMIGNDEDNYKMSLDTLHSRELEVLRMAAKGMTNKEIADILFLSYRTVQTHFTNIFRKLGVDSRTEGVLQALKSGWLKLEDLM